MNYKKYDKVFSIKGQIYDPSCKLYQGDCIYKDDDTCKTEPNVITRSGKQNNPTHDSDPMHHLKNYLNYSFSWLFIANVTNNKWTQKNLKAIYIALKRPKLNDQFETY